MRLNASVDLERKREYERVRERIRGRRRAIELKRKSRIGRNEGSEGERARESEGE